MAEQVWSLIAFSLFLCLRCFWLIDYDEILVFIFKNLEI
jgi:hypothetical protein